MPSEQRNIQFFTQRHTESDRRRKSISQIQIRQCEHDILFSGLFSQTSVSSPAIMKDIFHYCKYMLYYCCKYFLLNSVLFQQITESSDEPTPQKFENARLSITSVITFIFARSYRFCSKKILSINSIGYGLFPRSPL